MGAQTMNSFVVTPEVLVTVGVVLLKMEGYDCRLVNTFLCMCDERTWKYVWAAG